MANMDELRALLGIGEVHFTYTKLDGTTREAFGTLSTDLIPWEKSPLKRPKGQMAKGFKYFDLRKKAWRSVSDGTSEVEVHTVSATFTSANV